jgi:iron(III) transport system substrate-binding protein
MIALAKEEGGSVLTVGSHGDELELLKGFKEKYPFIEVKGLTLNTTKTINRVVTEVKAGRVSIDVFETSDDGAFALYHQDALQKPAAPYSHLKAFDPRLQPSSGLFVTLTLTPRIQGAYNTEMVAPDEVPASWDDMTDPKWNGKTVISSSSEELPGRLAWLWREGGELNWERSFDFWTKMRQHEPLVASGYTRGLEQVAAGERAMFPFRPPGSTIRYMLRGAPVDIIAFPTYLTGFRSMGIIKGAPHPASAWLLIDYLTSPEGQFDSAEVAGGGLPLHPEARANLGQISQLMVERGATWENSEAADPDFNLDAMAAMSLSPEVAKKSENFFLELMGIR